MKPIILAGMLAASVAFAPDPTHQRTVREVFAIDRPGILSVVGRAMHNCGVRLHDARITTIGERAEDYFYITDFVDQPLTKSETQDALRAAIVAELNV